MKRVVPEDEKKAGRVILAIIAALFIWATISWYKEREQRLEQCARWKPDKARYEECMNPPQPYDPTIEDPGYGELW